MVMRPEHNGMEKLIMEMLIEKTGFVDGQQIRLLDKTMLNSLLDGDVQATVSSFHFPELHLLVFLHGKDENEWQEHDELLFHYLRFRCGMKVLSIMFRRETQLEAQRVVNEIVAEAGLNHQVSGDHPEFFVWDKADRFCMRCGRRIGVWAWKHKKLCQSCSMLRRIEKQKAAGKEAKLKQVQEVKL